MVIGRGRGSSGASNSHNGLNHNPWSGNPVRQSASASSSQSYDQFREKMIQMAEKSAHLFDDESSEEELDDAEILKLSMKTRKHYDEALEGTEEIIENQFLQDVLQSGGAVTCLVCIETVKRQEAIWSCLQCYCIFHLPCIQKWSRESVGRQAVAMDEKIRLQDLLWNCPKCRTEYKQTQCPTKYYCFCNKEEDPAPDPWIVPHSCGQKCGRNLRPECGHHCLLLCHPGPCSPCPKTVNVKCFCGRSGPSVKRCSMKGWSCKAQCNALLTCGHHKCEEKCHEGDCPACHKRSEQFCLCGKAKTMKPCAEPEWTCQKVCGKELNCSHHVCERLCHAGSCGDCPRSGKRTCPCGKTASQLPCTEDVPSCEDTCMKELECAVHKCSKRCHYGPCDTCLQVREKTCRCGRRTKELPCNQVYLCDTKCMNTRSCGRHPCKKKCCDGDCPPCEQVCNRSLNCRNHRCQSPCHTGPCYPCPLSQVVSCFCANATTTVPCGRERTSKPPRCKKTCSIPPDCHHPERAAHFCHFGQCPPCKFKCEKKLSSCEHFCQEVCHEHVFDKAATEKNKLRSTNRKADLNVYNSLPCPSCKAPVPKQCLGKHVNEEFPCCELKSYSCKRACGRQLPCGNHVCQRECHLVKGHPQEGLAGKNCYQCEDICLKIRPEGCSHDCKLPCHPGSCPDCEVHLKLDCFCKTIQVFVNCSEFNNADEAKKAEMLCCKAPCPIPLSCGHLCPKICHKGECSSVDDCREMTKIKCPCGRRKKTFPCPLARNGEASLECDERCEEVMKKKRQQQKEEDEARKSEEIQKQKEELEKFERKKLGKKRKQRRVTDTEDEISSMEKYKTILIIFSILLVALAGSLALLLPL